MGIAFHEDLPEENLSKQFGRIAENVWREDCIEEKVNILRIVMDEMVKDKTEKHPNLRNVDWSRLKEAALEVNEVTGFIETWNITKTNMILVAAANVVAILRGYGSRKNRKKVESWRKRRIRQKIKQLRRIKWYSHVRKPALESEKSKTLWDFKIQTDEHIR